MAAVTSVQQILGNFIEATQLATQSLPELESLLPPENGITLLDTKSEIFLSYLQALALRNLNVIRSLKDGVDPESARKISNDITRKLVEHRVYLERGVRPLEQKIKYQVDRAVKAADDEARGKSRKSKASTASISRIQNGTTENEVSSGDSSDEDSDESDNSDTFEMDSTFSKPNLNMMADGEEDNAHRKKGSADGIYRPPRFSATSMPEPDRRERAERRPARSRMLDEYVSTEMSAAPLAEPSIGSNIALGGRRSKSARQLAEEKERREYEETNLVRLPKESKKERAKKGLRGREAGSGYGGEDWRDLGASVDRIGDLTRKKSKDNTLDRSRKRRAVEDSPRDGGMGNAFDIKKRRLMKRM